MKNWLRNQPLVTDEELDKRHMYRYLTVLRAHIYLGQYRQGIHLGEKLQQFCSTLYLQYYVAETQMLLAILYERNGDTDSALRKIEHAIELGQEEGYIRLFLNVWELAESVVRKYGKHAQISKVDLSFVEQLMTLRN